MNQFFDFNDPNIQNIGVPLLISFLSIGILKVVLGEWKGTLLSALGIGLGYIGAYILIREITIWPLNDALSILPLLIIGSFIIGPCVDSFDIGQELKSPLFIAYTLGIIYWLAGGNQGIDIDSEGAVFYGLLIVAGFWIFQKLDQNKDECNASPIACLSAFAGLTLIGFLSNSDIWEHALAFTAALFGFLMWNWPKCRHPWNTTGSLISASGYLIIAVLMVHEKPTLAFPVGFTFFTFLIYDISSRVFPTGPKMQPFIQLILSGIPIALSGFLVFYGV